MKSASKLIFFLGIFLLMACNPTQTLVSSKPIDPNVLSDFIVFNNAEVPVKFNIKTVKLSSMGSFPTKVSYSLEPGEKKLVKQSNLKQKADMVWFENFHIYPIDKLNFNDPNKIGSWKQDASNPNIFILSVLTKD